jgi:hypothetical protein
MLFRFSFVNYQRYLESLNSICILYEFQNTALFRAVIYLDFRYNRIFKGLKNLFFEKFKFNINKKNKLKIANRSFDFF